MIHALHYRQAKLALVLWIVATLAARLASAAEPLPETKVEAAISLQILGFTEWPPAKAKSKSPRVRRIGVFESEDSFQAFKSLAATSRFNNRFTIVAINKDSPAAQLESLDALYFPDPQPTELPRLLQRLETSPTVFLGSYDDFLEMGGMVNISKRNKRLGFEIHLPHANQRGIHFRSKLLRLARRLVKE